MALDIPHIIVTGVLIFVVIWGVYNISAFDDYSKGKKTFVQFAVLFIVLFILNILWPYG